MAKKRKVIKRVYESGRETTVLTKVKKPKTKASSVKTLKKPVAKKVTSKLAKPRGIVKETSSYRQKPPVSQPIYKEPKINRFKEDYELPYNYNITQLTLMVKDPFWMYAYWEITDESLNSAKAQISSDEQNRFTIVVRVYDISLKDFNGYNANYHFDVDVGFHASSWYINLWNDGASYTADLGLKTVSGKFIHITRANVVHTPRIGYAPRSEQVWMHMADSPNSKAYATYRKRIKQYNSNSNTGYKQANKRKIYLTEDDIRNYYSALSPLLRDVIAYRLSKSLNIRGRKYSFVLEGDSALERKTLLSNLPENFFIKRMLKGASDLMVILGQRSQAREGASFASSEFLHQKLHRTFFFEIRTELMVYGRTVPDAQVHLGTKNIPLKSDGTFVLRFSLADQKIHLPFKAESKGTKDSRAITAEVQRVTEYSDQK
jgi:uncharacterized protein